MIEMKEELDFKSLADSIKVDTQVLGDTARVAKNLMDDFRVQKKLTVSAKDRLESLFIQFIKFIQSFFSFFFYFLS